MSMGIISAPIDARLLNWYRAIVASIGKAGKQTLTLRCCHTCAKLQGLNEERIYDRICDEQESEYESYGLQVGCCLFSPL